MTVLKAGFLAVAATVAALSVGSSTPVTHATVQFGINGTAAQYQELRKEGMPVSVLASWVSWSQRESPQATLSEASANGATPFIVWQPEDGLHPERMEFSTPKIAAGQYDKYITEWAQTIKNFGAPVYIRFAHEMNGHWYAWSASGPQAYVAAWRHVYSIFQSVGATNAQFLWSPDGLIGHFQGQWEREVKPWFPGRAYVNDVGMSTVMFRSTARYGIDYFFRRLDFLHHYRKPMILPEMKVFAGARYNWLQALRGKLQERPWIKLLLWSETPSTAQAAGQFNTGQMDWSLIGDGRARRMLRTAVRH